MDTRSVLSEPLLGGKAADGSNQYSSLPSDRDDESKAGACPGNVIDVIDPLTQQYIDLYDKVAREELSAAHADNCRGNFCCALCGVAIVGIVAIAVGALMKGRDRSGNTGDFFVGFGVLLEALVLLTTFRLCRETPNSYTKIEKSLQRELKKCIKKSKIPGDIKKIIHDYVGWIADPVELARKSIYSLGVEKNRICIDTGDKYGEAMKDLKKVSLIELSKLNEEARELNKLNEEARRENAAYRFSGRG